MDENILWKKVKKTIRAYEQEEGRLVFDDTIIEKPCMDENEIACWYFYHKTNRVVKGINLLTAFYQTEKEGQALRMPVGFKIAAKTGEYTDKKSGGKKRRSLETKNEMMREMIGRQIRNAVKFRYSSSP